ncbi:MAG: methylmalonyl-CoA epimerase [Gemmatimonadetes bacterium]|nr:methylmalonyl-CoA epimerase [Gemmatimonadota bacterium]
MSGLPVDHVAVAVPSLRDVIPLFERLTGHSSSEIETLADQGVNVAFVGPLELLEPSHPDGPVVRFLQRRGPGLHHIAFRVPDVAAALRSLEDAGFQPIDREPRRGARGHRVAFLHPRHTAGVLLELVEA